MIIGFNEDAFRKGNKEIISEIQNYKSIIEYLDKIGLKKIQRGTIKFHLNFEPFDGTSYLKLFSDVRTAIEEGKFSSGFEHFCLYGYQEIITNQRRWNQYFSPKSDNQSYGHIDKFENYNIEGWAGCNLKIDNKVELYINNIFFHTITPTILRQDLQSHKTYKYCKGFIVHLDIKKLIQLFQTSKTDDIVISMRVNDIWTEMDFSFSKDNCFMQIVEKFTQNNFLYQLDLFQIGLENYLSLEQLIDSLTWLDTFGLHKHLVSIKSQILTAINKSKIEYGDTYSKLYELLFNQQDILLELSKELYKIENKTLLTLINRVLNDINYQDAHHVIQNITLDRENIFFDEKIEKNIQDDALINYLANNPKEILDTWKNFDEISRQEKALSFINLYVFLQEFDKVQYLELSLDELHQLVHSDNKLPMETMPRYLFANGQEWNGLLLTFYFISVGVRNEQLLTLIHTLMENIYKFDYINSSALQWLFQTKLFNNSSISLADIKKIMKNLSIIINEKSLWNDELIREIYQEYLVLLLTHRDNEFDATYKLCLKHYLLNNNFTIPNIYLDNKYLIHHYLLWVINIEMSRKMIMENINNSTQINHVISKLNQLTYLAPEITNRVKFELYNSIINLSDDKTQLHIATTGLMQVGGAYDKLKASQKNTDSYQQNYYESLLVDNTIKWKEDSLNNYWYNKALNLRYSTQSKRKEFLEELYLYIKEFMEVSQDELRLIRLFYSELIVSIEKGLKIETTLLGNIKVETILENLTNSFSNIKSYSDIFNSYLDLHHRNANQSETIHFKELSNQNFDFESKSMLKEMLKLNSSNYISIEDAKKSIKQAMVYPYCLVMIYSCQSYIPTRQKLIRETWLNRLKEFDIDYFFVVGGSDKSKVKDDMMYLSVEDSYEKLPQKSIEMFRFASEAFSHERFLKIDDDCFLNVDAYFSDNSLFNADYYGRYLERGIGTTDRTWHQAKSQSDIAKNSIDLSPEPSFYADGSTGYALSRIACEKLIEAYKNQTNQKLVANSFMEDKLVGDLLIGEGVTVNSINFNAVIYRKTTINQEATFWEYNIFPHCDNRVKILHCETPSTMNLVWKYFRKKNSFSKQKQYFSNIPLDNLPLTTPYIEEINVKYTMLNDAYHVAIIVCQNEFSYLEQSLEHHRSIGIEHFIYIDNGSNDGSLEFMLSQQDISVFITTQPYKDHRFGVSWIEAALSNFCIGKWVLVIDSDELFVYDDFENHSIKSLTSYADNNGYDSFLAPMIDMYGKDTLYSTDLHSDTPYKICNYFDNISTMNILEKNSFGPYSNSQVYYAGLRARIFGNYNRAPDPSYLNQKYCLFKYKPTHRFIEGLHFMYNHKLAPIRASILHFKYHSSFYEKVVEQIESGQHWNGSQEYKRYLNKLKEDKNLSLYDETVSIKYIDSGSLISAGYMDKIVN